MKKKQKEMYDDYKRNPVRSILKEKKARRRRKRIKALLFIFILVYNTCLNIVHTLLHLVIFLGCLLFS